MSTESNANENITAYRSASYEDESDILELFSTLWKGKLWIVGVTIVSAVISTLIALSLPNIYRSEALLAADEQGGGALSDLASQYGGLASLAGISIPSAGSTDKSIGLEILKSRQFITDFIQKRQVLPDLMAIKSYDPITQKIAYDKRIYDPVAGSWARELKAPYNPKPSAQEAYEEFMRHYNVRDDSDTGFVRVSIEHRSPIIAQQWVTWLVKDINERMMTKAEKESQQSIDFLSKQIESTNVVALQEVFYSLIEEQTKTILLAKVRSEYIFETIDPAIAPEEKAKPRRAIIIVLGTTLGCIFISLIFILRFALFGRENKSAAGPGLRNS